MKRAMLVGMFIVLIAISPTAAGYTYPTTAEVDGVLNAYRYPYGYQINVYDCSDMSTTLAFVLQYYYDWNTSIAIKENFDNEGTCHAWVLVETRENRWTAIETTYTPLQSLGIRIYDTNYYTGINEIIEWYEADLYMR